MGGEGWENEATELLKQGMDDHFDVRICIADRRSHRECVFPSFLMESGPL